MKKKFDNQFLRTLAVSFSIVLIVLGFTAPVSCRLTEEGIEIIPADTTAPAVENFLVTGSKNLSLSCSEKIVLDRIQIHEIDADQPIEEFMSAYENEEECFALANVISYSEDGKSAEIELSQEMDVGHSYVFSGLVYDITGNSLEFSQKFTGYNANPARLIFNEVRTTYNKAKSAVEFIEFYVLKSGNTFGLEYVSAANGEGKKYVFPAMEVKRGEYITLHGKILEGMEDEALDETGEELDLSSAAESCDTARDLWKSGNDKIVSNTDVLILRDGLSLEIADALLLSQSGKSSWPKKAMTEYAEKACSLGIWPAGSLPENAISTDFMTSSIYRSISRQNTRKIAEWYEDESKIPKYISNLLSDWIVTDKKTVSKATISGSTPGWENSSNPYVPK